MSDPASRPSSDVPPPLSLVWRAPRQYVRRQRARIEARLGEGPGPQRACIAVLALAGLAALFLFWWLYLLVATPSVGELREARYAQATLVLTSDGKELTRYSAKNRNWVPLDSISTHVTDALIATEDRRFRSHMGIDWKRTGGAILQTATGNVQGGSTITMQLARNAFPEFQDDFILTRKFKEWLTAIHIEDLYTKDEVLEMYLNTVPFLYNAFGIEAAAQTYFGKPAFELNETEAATLVAMLKGPAYYNPRQHPDRSRERRDVVLGQMREAGYLTDGEYESLRQQKTTLDFDPVSYGSERAPHFTQHLRQRLQEWAEEEGYNLYTSGLRIYTPLDSRMQKAAERAVSEMGERLQSVAQEEWGGASFPAFWDENPELVDRFVRQSRRFEQLTAASASADSALTRLKGNAAFLDSLKQQRARLEAGFVAVDPSNGHVKAWVGGRDFEKSKYDHVAQAKRQPGSTFKPFVYATALNNGFAPDDRIRDEVRTYEISGSKSWSPKNFGGSSGRLMTVRNGLAQSKNTITARLMMKVGPEKVVETAHDMGIQSELNAVPSLALGTSPVRLLEMAGAYTTIADQGTYHQPVTVTRIEDRSGDVLARFGGEERRGLNPSTAYTLLDMMRGVVDGGGTGQRIRSSYGARGDLAGKTGTTQKGADGWFMLMHPNLVMGSWVGFSTSALHFRSRYWGQGSHTALPIVGRFYQQAGLSSDATFEPPPGYDGPAESTRALSRQDSLESQAAADSLNRATRDSTAADSVAADSSRADSTAAEDADSLHRERSRADSVSRRQEETQESPADTARPEEPSPAQQEPPARQDTSEASVGEEDQAGDGQQQEEEPQEDSPETDTTNTSGH